MLRLVDENDVEVEFDSLDMDAGRTIPDKIFIAHHEAVEEVKEESHIEVIAEYPETGGKDTKKVIDVAAQEAKDAYDEYEDVIRYVKYTEAELAEMKISSIKEKLQETDYIASKALDRLLSAKGISDIIYVLSDINNEYSDIVRIRQTWRDSINDLEKFVETK